MATIRKRINQRTSISHCSFQDTRPIFGIFTKKGTGTIHNQQQISRFFDLSFLRIRHDLNFLGIGSISIFHSGRFFGENRFTRRCRLCRTFNGHRFLADFFSINSCNNINRAVTRCFYFKSIGTVGKGSIILELSIRNRNRLITFSGLKGGFGNGCTFTG